MAHPIPLVDHTFLRDIELVNRLEWIIALRWIAVVFIFFTTFFAEKAFHLSLQSITIYIIILIISGYNLLFLFYARRIIAKDQPTRETQYASHNFAFIQGLIDLSFLTVVLHYTGGIENPFIFFYIFHIIIASLLLKKTATFIQAVFSSILIAGTSIAEYLAILPHYPIGGFLIYPLYNNKIYLIAVNVVFISTIFISAFISTSISERLRKKEDELSLTKLKLEEANISLQEQDRLKSEYVKVVSHDLKSPLSAIKGLVDIIRNGYTSEENKKTMEVLEKISNRVDDMMQFIKNLLDLSKIKSKIETKKERIQILYILKEAIEAISGDAKAKGISIEMEFEESLPLVCIDRDEFKDVFLNLLTNAIKYNREDGNIWIKAMADKRDDTITIEITDSGIGIPEKDIPYIFDEFYRASNAKTYYPNGSGLGLSIVKCIVERHGGSISVESSKDKGSKFYIVLPLLL